MWSNTLFILSARAHAEKVFIENEKRSKVALEKLRTEAKQEEKKEKVHIFLSVYVCVCAQTYLIMYIIYLYGCVYVHTHL